MKPMLSRDITMGEDKVMKLMISSFNVWHRRFRTCLTFDDEDLRVHQQESPIRRRRKSMRASALRSALVTPLGHLARPLTMIDPAIHTF